MSADADDGRARRLDEVLQLVRAKVTPAQRTTVADFTARYYREVEAEDLAERQTADLYGAALSHWNFARKREAGKARIRVFNPTLEEHGWQSTHTIVEIVNDDMPFLVDSVTMEVNRHGLTLHLIIHPVVEVERGADGALVGLVTGGGKNSLRESFIHVEVDRIIDPARLDTLSKDIARVLDDVRAAVDDWKAMGDRVRAIVAEVQKRPPPLPADELSEGEDFLRWLADNHFTFLGYRCHELAVVDGEDVLKIVPGSSLGILREGQNKEFAASFSALPPEVRAYARRPELLVVTKSTSRSTVHRPGYLDYIAIKRFDAKGDVVGEDRFLGLFTSTAYSANAADIPLLRRKVANVIKRAGLPAGGHAGKALVNILDTYPRDELFQTSEDDLLRTAKAILHLGDRQRLRLFVRRDAFERFLSCLIYAPREKYTTELRQKWQALLTQAFGGSSSEFNAHLSESPLARVMIIVRTTPGQIPAYDVRALEAQLVAATRRWEDDLKVALIDALGEARGNELLRQFGSAFPAAYREEFAARAAVPDIEMMARLTDCRSSGHVALSPARSGARRAALQAVSPRRAGDAFRQPADARAHGPQGARGAPVPHHSRRRAADLDARPRAELACLPTPKSRSTRCTRCSRMRSRRCFAATSRTTSSTAWWSPRACPRRRPSILRAYAKYLRQIGFPLSQAFIQGTLSGARRHRARARRAVPAALRSGRRRGCGRAHRGAGAHDRGRARGGRQPVRGPRAAPVSRAHPGDDAHQFLAPRCGGTAQELPVVQVRPVQGARAAGAQADVRDLRLFDALRRRAPARRQGRARRPALVGPAGGFPHRGAGPGQGADGQEHGDRPGGLERRLRAQARAGGDRPRGVPEGRHRLLPGLSARPARPHRQPRRRQDRAAARRQAPRPGRSVSGRGRRQGHGDVSPTTPTRSARSTASGSATPSRRAARWATTTRRWASRRAARGSR